MAHAARTIAVPQRVSDGMETNFYMILYDFATGNLVNAGTGVPAADVTWANAAFDDDHYTAQTITDFKIVSIPALTEGITYGYQCFDAASPAKTDVPTRSGLYSAETGTFYTSSIPTYGGQVSVTSRRSTIGLPRLGR